MTDPITLAIAAAIAGKGAEAFGAQAAPAIARLVRRVKARFAGHPEGSEALVAAEADPDDPGRTEALATALDAAAADDPELATELHTLRQQVQQVHSASGNAVVNNFQGNTEKFVQLRDVHGDINLG